MNMLRNLLRAKLFLMMTLAGMLLVSGCDVEHRHHDRDFHRPIGGGGEQYIPPGGEDFGTLFHFDHVFSERSISNSSDLDGFEFRLAQQSVVLITATSYGGLDAFLDLYRADFSFIGGDSDGGPGLDPILVGTFAAGDYFVVVGGVDGTVGDYDIDISVEPLGGADFGGLFAPTSVLDDLGFLDGPEDFDSYIFTVYDTVFCDIYLTGDPGLDTDLQLLNEYGQEIAYTDVVGPNAEILGETLAPGTYIIRVGTFSGSGGYTLELFIS
jgi:hypothetical protein